MSTALEALGVIAPSVAAVAKPESSNPSLVKTIVPGAAAGVLGYALFPKHPVLGFFAGEAVGLNAVRILRNQANDRTKAVCNLGMTTTAVIGSLATPKHPFWGYVGGLLLGAVATSFVEGSNAHNFKKKVLG